MGGAREKDSPSHFWKLPTKACVCAGLEVGLEMPSVPAWKEISATGRRLLEAVFSTEPAAA